MCSKSSFSEYNKKNKIGRGMEKDCVWGGKAHVNNFILSKVIEDGVPLREGDV